jgi:hypothetical protein
LNWISKFTLLESDGAAFFAQFLSELQEGSSEKANKTGFMCIK